MSEIQEAAEIITAAVAPDANIIFGATLKPEIEDELIITVIATGFDSEYFHERTPSAPPTFGTMTSPAVVTSATDDVTDDDIKNVDMDLDNDQTAHVASSFNDEEPTGNIWHQVDEDESDTPAFLRRRKK
jgi:cell division protein FtsZ